MKKPDNDESTEINEIAESMGLQYPVLLSNDLSETLKPNKFLSELGINFSDRISLILSILRGSLKPDLSSEEKIPQTGIIFPIPVVQGPYIKEQMISVKAEMYDGDGEEKILLTVVRETE